MAAFPAYPFNGAVSSFTHPLSRVCVATTTTTTTENSATGIRLFCPFRKNNVSYQTDSVKKMADEEADEEESPLQKVTIHKDPSLRIDKYRANQPSATSLHPATLVDHGGSIEAVAKVTITTSTGPELTTQLERGATIHRLLDAHPNITKVYGVRKGPTHFTLLLEKAACSLRDVIHPTTPETRELRVKVIDRLGRREVIRQVFIGLAFIHSKTDEVKDKISHRDVKPENLLIFIHERDGTITIKFTDFDSAKQLEVDESVYITTNIFTEMYKDPNISRKKEDGESVIIDDYLAADIFAAALVAYEVLVEEHMFKGRNHISTLMKMQNNDRSNLVKKLLDELAKNLLWVMTQPLPKKRIPMKVAAETPYFRSLAVHVQMINEATRAFLGLRDSLKDRAIKEDFEWSFFMVFRTRWMDQPFVLLDILKGSNYDHRLSSAVRYICYLLIHLGEHEEAVKAHFGKLLTVEELLVKIVECLPRILIHLYWFTTQNFPQLACTKYFPVQCAEAYEELMKSEKAKIPNMEALYAEVCPPLAVAAASPEKDNETAANSNFVSNQTGNQIGSNVVANSIINVNIIGAGELGDTGKTCVHWSQVLLR